MNKRILSITILGILPFLSLSQTNLELLPTYDPAAYAAPGNTVLMQADGKILLGGEGTGFGPKRLLPDGSLDPNFNTAVQNFNYLLDHSSGIYAFGNGATRLGQTGAVNLPIANTIDYFCYNNNTANSGNVNDVLQLEDGSIILVGNFDRIRFNAGGGSFIFVNSIVRLQSNFVEDFNFTLNTGTGFNGEVKCITFDTINDKIYCGGKFTTFNGNYVDGICRLNMDGTYDATFNSGSGFIQPTEFPTRMRMMNDGRILISGSTITNYNGNARSQNLMLNNDGSLNTDFVTTDTGIIEDFYEISNDRMITVGDAVQYVNSITGVSVNNSGAYGTVFLIPGSNTQPNMHQYSIQKVEEGIFLIAGTFTEVNGIARNKSAKIYMCDQDPNVDLTFSGGVISTDFIGDSYVWQAWDPTDTYELTLTNNTSSTFTPTEPGMYYLTSTNGACNFETSIDLTELSVSEMDQTSFTIFPNPTNGEIKISNLAFGSKIEICDLSGKIVKTASTEDSSLNIDLTSLNLGTYFVHVTDQNNQRTTKRISVTN